MGPLARDHTPRDPHLALAMSSTSSGHIYAPSDDDYLPSQFILPLLASGELMIVAGTVPWRFARFSVVLGTEPVPCFSRSRLQFE